LSAKKETELTFIAGAQTFGAGRPWPVMHVVVAIRPEDIAVSRSPSGLNNEFPAKLDARVFLGDITVYHLSTNGAKLRGKTTQADRELTVGSRVHVRLPPDKVRVFPK
jgi:ABC-type Fe3+/spermidine/putrescine transport system ATPase subunit